MIPNQHWKSVFELLHEAQRAQYWKHKQDVQTITDNRFKERLRRERLKQSINP